MANKLHLLENPPDNLGARYVVFYNAAGQGWNPSAQAYQAFSTTRDDFDNQATHIGGGKWEVAVPGNLPAGYTTWEWYKEATPGARSHANDQRKAIGEDFWDGEDLVSTAPLSKASRDRFERSLETIVLGTVAIGSSLTTIITNSMDPAPTANDQFKGRVVLFEQDTVSSALRGQAARVISNTFDGVLEVTSLTSAPVLNDTFTIT